ncbi:helix-turn-helix domain-containing protein [Ornithinimicrobium cryptoxanthini]|uniref:GAF domain-containing protein n=1 Tax=Ornithinimicrobium cryptoxanthini TaxID=2934161 RepID=A0ABY4YJ39_9MICO|nr:GAF domain-containing protein [Ornithinimicrobium cryptoxanthini]USQ76624.1 GAF domain-containing protein [Ornithinimicrobium cryptoxanthini]
MTEQDLAEHFLALLADDRPLSDYEELRKGAGPDEQAAADRVHALALRARGLREQDRRREAELSALFDTVADLAALKDLDDVLEAIVRRVRTLLGCDVSYLSLNDDELGATYMRVTQGIHTEEFRNVRLGFGEGLGGLVAQTARPYMTDDYFADERFNHTRPIDSAVDGEELRAILGVPLLLGRTVIGVLYAANHDARPFSRADVGLLTSFAGHAAVALDNARRIRETQAALADLKQTSELLQRNVEGVQLASVAHERLTGVVLQGGSLDDMVHELHQVLQEPVHVIDAHGATLASSAPDDPPAGPELELVSIAFGDSGTHVEGGVSIAPVFAGGTPLAAVLTRSELDDVSRRILERAATTAALIMVVQRSVSEAQTRRRADLLVDLLVGRSGAGSLTARASLLGTDLAQPHAVLVVDGADAQLKQSAVDLTTNTNGLSADVGERLVLVLPDVVPLEAGRRLARRATSASNVPVGRAVPTVGAAGPVTGVDGVRAAYEESSRCLDALLALGRRGDVADAATLGFVGLLMGRHDPGEHVHARLGALLDYDEERGTELVQTLALWLAEDRHLARTGERLHVHPNTVTQRLDRIGRLLGDGWQSPENLLELGLALRLRSVLPHSHGAPTDGS